MKINYNELMDFTDIEIKEDTSKIDEIVEYEEILFEISNSLKKYRKENNLTQKQLAELLEFDQVMISKLESGNYNPTFKQLHKISRKLTNSAGLFVNVLENIIDNINQMYKTTYKLTIKKEKYNKKEENNIIYMSDYIYNLQGGIYGTEKCTSTISVAG
jgi:transcriptional regulator with XRE-family HTH domain